MLNCQAAWQSRVSMPKNNCCLFSVYGSGIRISHSLSHLILMIWVKIQDNMGCNSVINKFHWNHSTAKPWPAHLLAHSQSQAASLTSCRFWLLRLQNSIQGGKKRTKNAVDQFWITELKTQNLSLKVKLKIMYDLLDGTGLVLCWCPSSMP